MGVEDRQKMGRPGSIRHVNDVGGCEVDVGGEGPHCQNNTLDHSFERSITVLGVRTLP